MKKSVFEHNTVFVKESVYISFHTAVDVKKKQLDLEKCDGVIHMITMNSCSGFVESTRFMVNPEPITDLKIHFLLTLKNTPFGLVFSKRLKYGQL